MLGPGFSDPEVAQLVKSTECGSTGGREPTTHCSLRKVKMGAQKEWLVCSGGRVVYPSTFGGRVPSAAEVQL